MTTLTCPHCEAELEPPGTDVCYDGDEFERECHACGGPVRFYAYVSIEWSVEAE